MTGGGEGGRQGKRPAFLPPPPWTGWGLLPAFLSRGPGHGLSPPHCFRPGPGLDLSSPPHCCFGQGPLPSFPATPAASDRGWGLGCSLSPPTPQNFDPNSETVFPSLSLPVFLTQQQSWMDHHFHLRIFLSSSTSSSTGWKEHTFGVSCTCLATRNWTVLGSYKPWWIYISVLYPLSHTGRIQPCQA